MKSFAEHSFAYSTASPDHRLVPSLNALKWAGARLLFFAYIAFSMGTLGLGGFLTAPIMTWYFYGDWRVWRHWHSAKGLYPQAYKMLLYIVQRRNGGYMLSVPLTAQPHSTVNPDVVELAATWEFGTSCGPCSRCCEKIKCPILDRETGLCRGYDSFFWRYFNCGRFPNAQVEIDYYRCPKWNMKNPRARGKASAARANLLA